jgi:putative PIN family toxin of toxin-antitoxin system
MLNCRVVFDTNILISAVLSPNSKPFQCTALAKREIIQSVTCQDILDEFQEKLLGKLKYETERAQALVHEVMDYSQIVTLTNTLRVVAADPDDDMVVECAIAGNATYIVTGDKHLISLSSYQNVTIVKAADFLNLVLPN